MQHKTVSIPRPTSLILLSLLLLNFSACDQGEPTPTTPPPAPTATTPQSDPGSMVASEPNGFALPDDPEKVAALEEAGFTLTRNAAGFVTEIVIATETSIADVLPNLEGVPNVTQARFSGPGLTDEGMEALEFIFSVKRLDLSDSAIGDQTIETVGNLVNLEVLNLRRSVVSNDGLAKLNKLKRLREIGRAHV